MLQAPDKTGESPPAAAPLDHGAATGDGLATSRTPTRTDWLMMLGVAVLGGSSFAAIRIGVETAPPPVVAAGRLWIAFGFMLAYCRMTGRPFLPLSRQGRFNPAWLFALAIGVIGYAAPLTAIPWAQRTVSSLLAGIYIAFMPVMTVLLAALFADERLTARKAAGFLGGTAGVLVLIGPDALAHIFSEDVRAQLVLLLSVTGYAVASVVMRRAPDVPARSFAAAFLLCGALLATPGAIAAGTEGISARSWAAIVFLGLLPTGLNAVFIILTVRRVGAGFLSLSSYLAPLVAILLGVALFGEALEPRYLLGLAAILGGMALAEPDSTRALASRFRALSSRAGR
ncbi:DMT family transporter [Parvularcula dongshanensis]|uniref:Drug/metabolite transporter (DMT)-like permease n=1 Tax=Parvularcula dongshanensis TaxID=1173995 RepID=A0A840I5G1_9PROT|nr:DMT family transporter [Parvularcula dongshanensis]MBB4659434.1 drug/metabolite transporter (DMT)-like permease [Parvularcula dongshanensis]